MTHDELLAHINSKLKFCTCDRWIKKCWEDDNQPWLALRAVVELHKCSNPRFDLLCDCGQPYPCLTIQEIEKELK